MPSYPFSKIPSISGAEAVVAFRKAGWTLARQHGSHAIMVKEGREAILTIPQHQELKRGTLKAILMASGLSLDQFKALL